MRKFTGAVHFRYAEGASHHSELEKLARVFLGQLEATLGRIKTGAMHRSGPGWAMSMRFAYGAPIVDISIAGQVAVPELEELIFYMETGVLDVFTWNENNVNAQVKANLTRAPVATAQHPTGYIRFDSDGGFSFSPKEDGESRVTPKGFEDKQRRRTPASIYSGKLRLFIQALYGTTRTDFDGSSGSFVLLGDTLISPFFYGGHVLVNDEKYNYWLVCLKDTITAQKVILSDVGKLVKQRLLSGAMEQTPAEAYMLAGASISSDEIELGDSSLSSYPTPLAYGWQATKDGRLAQAVCVSIEDHFFKSGIALASITAEAGIIIANISFSGLISGAIRPEDSLVVPAGEALVRVVEVSGSYLGSFLVYGYYTEFDTWVEIRYANFGNLAGFYSPTIDARYQIKSGPFTAPSNSIEGVSTAHEVFFGSQLNGFSIPYAVPGSGPYPSLPPNYSHNDKYWVKEQFSLYTSGDTTGGTEDLNGSSLLVIPHFDCSAVYLIRRARSSYFTLSGQRGGITAWQHVDNWPQLFDTSTGTAQLVSDGDPPNPVEAGYHEEKEMEFTDWRSPLIRTSAHGGHGYIVTNGTFNLVSTRVVYSSYSVSLFELVSINEGITTGGTFQEGIQIPGFAIEYSTITPAPDVLAYITGNDFSPSNGLSLGSWNTIVELDFGNPVADAILQSYDSFGGLCLFAREPNSDPFEFTSTDTPKNLVIVGWK